MLCEQLVCLHYCYFSFSRCSHSSCLSQAALITLLTNQSLVLAAWIALQWVTKCYMNSQWTWGWRRTWKCQGLSERRLDCRSCLRTLYLGIPSSLGGSWALDWVGPHSSVLCQHSVVHSHAYNREEMDGVWVTHTYRNNSDHPIIQTPPFSRKKINYCIPSIRTPTFEVIIPISKHLYLAKLKRGSPNVY